MDYVCSAYYKYTRGLAGSLSMPCYVMAHTPNTPDYPYQCIVDHNYGDGVYLYCSTEEFTYYSSNLAPNYESSLRTKGRCLRYKYSCEPTYCEYSDNAPSGYEGGYWTEMYGPYTPTDEIANRPCSVMWTSHYIHDSGIFANHWTHVTPQYVSGDLKIFCPDSIERGSYIGIACYIAEGYYLDFTCTVSGQSSSGTMLMDDTDDVILLHCGADEIANSLHIEVTSVETGEFPSKTASKVITVTGDISGGDSGGGSGGYPGGEPSGDPDDPEAQLWQAFWKGYAAAKGLFGGG